MEAGEAVRDKAVLKEEFSGTDTPGLRLLAVDEIALLKGHQIHDRGAGLRDRVGRVDGRGEGEGDAGRLL